MPEKQKPLKANLLLDLRETPMICTKLIGHIDHVTEGLIQTKHNLHLMIVDMEKLRDYILGAQMTYHDELCKKSLKRPEKPKKKVSNGKKKS